jgi:hypothetical protein
VECCNAWETARLEPVGTDSAGKTGRENMAGEPGGKAVLPLSFLPMIAAYSGLPPGHFSRLVLLPFSPAKFSRR